MDKHIKSMLNRLERDIAEYGDRLERLIITRKTLLEMYGDTDTFAPPMLEDNRLATVVKRKQRTHFIPNREAWAKVREQVLDRLNEAPFTSGELIRHICGEGPIDKKTRDRVYGNLKELAIKNVVRRNDDGRYFIIEDTRSES